MENTHIPETKVFIKERQLFDGACDIKFKILDNKLEDILVVGIARGGLHLAQLLSYGLDCPVETISIQLRDSQPENEPEELYYKISDYLETLIKEGTFKNIIFTDDLIDSGETVDLIKKVYNDLENLYKRKLNINIHFAVSFMDSEYLETTNKFNYYYGDLKPNGWLVFPWDLI
jgi:hypoxanthine phosphoribosyltransferase